MTLLVGSIFHMTRKIVSEMTYNVSMGTLNPTIPYYTILKKLWMMFVKFLNGKGVVPEIRKKWLDFGPGWSSFFWYRSRNIIYSLPICNMQNSADLLMFARFSTVIPTILVMSLISILCTTLTLRTKHIPRRRFKLYYCFSSYIVDTFVMFFVVLCNILRCYVLLHCAERLPNVVVNRVCCF